MYWIKSVPQEKMYEPKLELAEIRLIYTDKTGDYKVPRMIAAIGGKENLESTHIIIYQFGYQAYGKQIFHDSQYTKEDSSFKERNNMVKLDRIPPNFDHRQQVEKIENMLNYGYLSDGKEMPEKISFSKLFEWERRRYMLEDRALFKDCCDGASFNPAMAHMWSEKTKKWYENSIQTETKKFRAKTHGFEQTVYICSHG